MEEVEVELSLGLGIGGGGELRKRRDVFENGDVLKQEARKKQEVRRGAIRIVDEDAEDRRVRKKMKSELCSESGNEGGGIIGSSDCGSISGQQKSPRCIAQVAAAGVKEHAEAAEGYRGSNSHIDDKLVGLSCVSTAPVLLSNLNGWNAGSQTSMAMSSNEGPERHAVSRLTPLAIMPCVSTTGNGPGGTTVRGFLYRYSREEDCIVCVCHRLSFSPAKFVEHAGGRDVENPLWHITVAPFPHIGS